MTMMSCSDRDAAIANAKGQIDAENNEIAREQARIEGGTGPDQRADLEKQIAQRQDMIDSLNEEILQLGRTPCSD
jgi:predicted  nucleic acid-binding Zn-ribbon protein